MRLGAVDLDFPFSYRKHILICGSNNNLTSSLIPAVAVFLYILREITPQDLQMAAAAILSGCYVEVAAVQVLASPKDWQRSQQRCNSKHHHHLRQHREQQTCAADLGWTTMPRRGMLLDCLCWMFGTR